MMKTFALSAALAISVAGIARASILPAPIAASDAGIIKVAEDCGAGWWRGPHGYCHPMATNRACPVGFHLGPEGEKCWPNKGYERACPPGFHLGPEGHRCFPG